MNDFSKYEGEEEERKHEFRKEVNFNVTVGTKVDIYLSHYSPQYNIYI